MQKVRFTIKPVNDTARMSITDFDTNSFYEYDISYASLKTISSHRIRVVEGLAMISLRDGWIPLAHKIFWDLIGYYPEIPGDELKGLRDYTLDNLVTRYLI